MIYKLKLQILTFFSIKEDIENKKITIDDVLYSINTYNAFVLKIYIEKKRKFYTDKEIKAFLNMFLTVAGYANKSLIGTEFK